MADVAYVIDFGLHMIVDAILALSAAEPKHIQWGTGVTGAATTDTGIETAAAEARTAGTTTAQQTSTASDTYRVVGTIVCAGAGKAITEVALYDTATAGIAFMHGTFTVINVSVGDSITFTINNVFTR